jgi:hypothetical protein
MFLSWFNDNTKLNTLQSTANLYIYILVLCYIFVFLVFKISTSSAQDNAVHEMYHTRASWSIATCSLHLKDNPEDTWWTPIIISHNQCRYFWPPTYAQFFPLNTGTICLKYFSKLKQQSFQNSKSVINFHQPKFLFLFTLSKICKSEFLLQLQKTINIMCNIHFEVFIIKL